jgi:hypothetical protein
LIFFASSSVYPVAPDFPTFSDPARSTRNNFPVFALQLRKNEKQLHLMIKDYSDE